MKPPEGPARDAAALRQRILELVAEYTEAAFPQTPFVPNVSKVPCAGRVFDRHELQHLVEASLDFWLTAGPYAERFEREFARVVGVREAILTNSGSSANLLAVSALTSPRLGDRRLVPGDEVITVAAGFPTTVAPIVQNQLVPVFVDVVLPTYDVDVAALPNALSPRTRAVILAHTLGNPFDLEAVAAFARKHDLWLIEDCCDALGSRFQGRSVGTFGDLATFSFYPAHHITMGEGGCVVTNEPRLRTIVESFRDWGRDCWCPTGHDNTCGKRFGWTLGDLPKSYDHKYIYSHVGYNLKATDLQAAIGLAQLGKLDGFCARRRANFGQLRAGLADLADCFVLPEPTPGSDPSWFGFPLSVRREAPFGRPQIVQYLEDRGVATRPGFGGNLVRQPAFRDVPQRRIGPLPNSDFVMTQSFWTGVYPGLSEAAIDYVIHTLHEGVAALGRR